MPRRASKTGHFINTCNYYERLDYIKDNPNLLLFYTGKIPTSILERALRKDKKILYKIDHTRISVPVLERLVRRKKYALIPEELYLKLYQSELYDILFS